MCSRPAARSSSLPNSASSRASRSASRASRRSRSARRSRASSRTARSSSSASGWPAPLVRGQAGLPHDGGGVRSARVRTWSAFPACRLEVRCASAVKLGAGVRARAGIALAGRPRCQAGRARSAAQHDNERETAASSPTTRDDERDRAAHGTPQSCSLAPAPGCAARGNTLERGVMPASHPPWWAAISRLAPGASRLAPGHLPPDLGRDYPPGRARRIPGGRSPRNGLPNARPVTCGAVGAPPAHAGPARPGQPQLPRRRRRSARARRPVEFASPAAG